MCIAGGRPISAQRLPLIASPQLILVLFARATIISPCAIACRLDDGFVKFSDPKLPAERRLLPMRRTHSQRSYQHQEVAMSKFLHILNRRLFGAALAGSLAF